VDGGHGRFTRIHGGVLANLVIWGEVPEIPELEQVQDTGWEFFQCLPVCSKPRGTNILFLVPPGTEHHLERVLMFYAFLYGD
jgi:hypothetical protein